MRAQRPVAFVIGPFTMQIELIGGELRRESIGIFNLLGLTGSQRQAQPVILRGLRRGRGNKSSRRRRRKKSSLMRALHRDYGVAKDYRYFGRLRKPHADLAIVRAENRKRIAMAPGDDRFHL
jgi:hypothetical protein